MTSLNQQTVPAMWYNKLLKVTIASAALSLVFSDISVAQNSLCDPLKRVLDSAIRFKSFKSLASSKQFIGDSFYASTNLPGTSYCFIKAASAGDSYICSMELGSSRAALLKAREMEGVIRACVPDFERRDRSQPNYSIFHISYERDTGRGLRLSVEVAHNPRGVEKDVQISVRQLLLAP